MHIWQQNGNILVTENMHSKYVCEVCDYGCSRKFLWEQHLTTRKHIGNASRAKVIEAKEPDKRTASDANFVCDGCGKSYKGRSGLWRHRKKCVPDSVDLESGGCKVRSAYQDVEDVYRQNQELKGLFKDVLSSLSKESENRMRDADVRNDLLSQLREQGKLIRDMVPRMGSNNNSVNISVFLNEKCRDAINMSDFIASLEVQARDLSFTRTNGLIEGLSSLFINGLRELDTFRRPIHCTDVLQETLYIKEDNAWDQDMGKERLRGALNHLAEKQRRAILEWESKNPEWDKDEKLRAEYLNLVQAVMKDFKGSNDENVIIASIASETVLNTENEKDKTEK